jgi:hypothetical protein
MWWILGAAGVYVVGSLLVLREWRTRRPGTNLAKVALAAFVVLQTFIAWVLVFGLVKSLGAVGGESVDPSQKARILVEGVSEGLAATAIGIVAIEVSSLLLTVFLLRRHPPSHSPGRPSSGS